MRWSLLRTILQSKFAKATILVPVVGYAILFNDNFLHNINLAPNHISSTSDANTDAVQTAKTLANLYFYYFGFTLIAVASALYSIFAPTEIKDSPDVLRFEEQRFATVTLNDMRIIAREVIRFRNFRLKYWPVRIFYAQRPRSVIEFFFKDISREAEQAVPAGLSSMMNDLKKGEHKHHYTMQLLNLLKERYTRDALRAFHAKQDFKYLEVRIISGVFFVVGSFLVIIPAVSSFVQILSKALPQLGQWLYEHFPAISLWVAAWLHAL